MNERLLALINSFPTLAKREIAHIGQIDAITRDRGNGAGAIAAARFIFFVWNGSDFDLYRAWACWDNDHRAAWKAWAADPWWC